MRTGDLAPNFTLPRHDGSDFTLSTALIEGPVVLFFYPAAMTRGCTKEACHFRDLAAEFDTRGAQRIGISMDDVARQSEFARVEELDYPLLADVGGRVASLYGVKRGLGILKVKRTTFIIGTDRRIRDVISSETSMNVHAERALATLDASA
jgi:peroxiredoxin Q/BCP